MKRSVRDLLGSLPSSGTAPKAVASLAPIALVLSAGTLSIASLYQQYSFISKEIQGTHDIQYLIHLKTIVKESRGLRQFPGDLPGQDLFVHSQDPLYHGHGDAHQESSASEPEGAALGGEVISALVARNREEVAQALSSLRWLEIRRRYGFHREDVKVDLVTQTDSEDFDLAEDFQRYTNRISELNEYFALVADQSNLILDPEIDTFYLMSLTTLTLPSIVDLIAEARGKRIGYDLRGSATQKQRDENEQDFVRLSNLLDFQLGNLNRTINILGYSSPGSYKSLEIDRLELVDKVNNLAFALRTKQGSGFDVAVSNWNESAEMIAFLQEIQFNGISILRAKLQERRKDLAVKIGMISLLVLSGILLIYYINNRLFGRLADALADIRELANTDALTKLLSRRSLPYLYKRSMASDSLESGGLGICLLDIDFFKAFNDTYGHLEGDDALVKVATILKDSLLRQTDYAFRFGGEEFLILFAAANEKKFEYFLQSIRRNVENLQIKHSASDVSDYLTVSMGGVFIPHRSTNLELELALLQADRELYKVKASSRNATSVVTLTDALQSDLKREIDADQDRRLAD